MKKNKNAKATNKTNNQVSNCGKQAKSKNKTIDIKNSDRSFQYDEDSSHSFEIRDCK